MDRNDESTLMKLARGTAERVAVHTDQVLWRVADMLSFLDPMVERRERTLAKAECELMLDLCRAVQADDPQLAGEPLYERTIARRLSCDPAMAREIIRHVDQSFAQWPGERDVNFRDVVNYMIVDRIMSAHSKTVGTRTDMEEIVAAVIPEGL